PGASPRWRTWTRCSPSATKRPTATGASTASRSIKNESEETLGYPAGQPRLSRGGQAVREETPPPGQRGQAAAGPCHPVQRGAVPGPGGAEPAGDHPGGAGPAGG